MKIRVLALLTLGIAAGVYGFTISGRGAVLGLTGAIFQMFAHGLVSAALFMVAGSLGHKIGTRNISELGGIAKRAPLPGMPGSAAGRGWMGEWYALNEQDEEKVYTSSQRIQVAEINERPR